MPRRIRDPQARQVLVDAAWRLAASGGLQSVTLRAVAAETGVTTGSVTHYFEDKAQLMAAVLRHNGDLTAHGVYEAVRGRRGLDAAEQATLAVLPLDEERSSIWRVWLAFWPTRPSLPGDTEFPKRYRAWTELIRSHLQEAIDDGDLPQGLDLPTEAALLGTLVAGTGLLTGANPEARRQVRERARRILAQHFADLARREPVRPPADESP